MFTSCVQKNDLLLIIEHYSIAGERMQGAVSELSLKYVKNT
jgi:hypothetical protein